ncbi:DUF3617 family protein [Diaphorobacter sp. HDW4A]|uniref:DUF3617 domain-containing protein n=1 Tax=Diaphorobacter sp. HDW4A TaxID=2714924 RepID=UPI001409BCC9|nr:DUF3617 family protein [Diaphorobacter sp. HDW4A]QIL79030.1 DUF3617 family protein [Diaphorobacter sp. HDW4A]
MQFLRARIAVPAVLAALTLAALPLTASAQEMPARKAGLWQITTSGTTGANKNPEQVMQQCVDTASDQALQKMGSGMMNNMKCEKNENKKDGNKYTGHAICQMGPSKMESKSVTSGDFEKEYTMTADSTFNPPMAGISSSKSVMVAKWVGPCKADQKPGDVIVNGQKMNLLNMGQPQKK